MNKAAHITVTGIVQGVGFRWFVERGAKKLGLCGYVKNVPNGNVEIDVEGDEGLIIELIQMVKVGNSHSRVTGVDVTWKEFKGKYSTFFIRF
ncbi:acylphosphatase [candidate division KSB1 bacterium]|nr:acylphosphatase [candidate division KSB1 bacterium]